MKTMKWKKKDEHENMNFLVIFNLESSFKTEIHWVIDEMKIE